MYMEGILIRQKCTSKKTDIYGENLKSMNITIIGYIT